MRNQLSKNAEIKQVITVTNGAAAATAINGAILDMANFKAVLFLLQFGAIVTAAVTSFKVSQSDNSDMSSSEDITGSNQTVADSDDEKTFYCDVIPTKRYVRLIVSRATQNATVSAIAIKYGSASNPIAQATPVLGETIGVAVGGTA